MEPQATRRGFLDVLLGTGLAGFLASLVYPILRYLKPIAPQGGGGPLKLTKEEQAKLEKEHSLIVQDGPKRILVFEDAQQQLRALSARCTHEGCTVQYVPGDALIWCACHNGKFDLEGTVISGPPPRPLAKWQAQRDPDGTVTVAPLPRHGPFMSLYNWLDKRYDLGPLIKFVQHKEVPVGAHSLFWYYLGGLTLFFFAVQIGSGALLLVYYQVGESTSYESIRFITTKVPFGWLVRSIHCWSAHLMIVSLVLHMLSTMLLKAYRPPRELTWVTGFALFAVALGFGFSGYLLPWNELAFFATAVGTDSVKAVPGIGDWLMQVMRGGPDVSGNTLYRFFALHVVILPLTIFGIVGVHLLFVQKQGMAQPVGHVAPRGMKFFPDFALRDALLWLLCLMLLGSLAVFLPYGPHIPGVEWELGHKANPLAPAYPGIKPEWYFLWVYQLLKEFPPHIFGIEGPQGAVLVVSVLMGVWALVPWLDRKAGRDQASPEFTDLGIAAVLFIAFLTLKAWDIGGGGAVQPDVHAVARVCAFWILAAGFAAAAFRYLILKQTWFVFTTATLLHAALHGLFGVSYLAAGAVAAIAAAVGVALTRPRSAPAAGGPP